MKVSGQAGLRQVPALAAVMVLAFVLAVVGAAQHLSGYPAGDIFYLALQTFVIQLPATSGGAPYPWTLDVARFLAPVAVGYTAIITFLLLFRDSMDHLRARRLRGHVVVCGLGDCGQQVVRSLLAAGRRVVAVDRVARPWGGRRIPTIVGDARERSVLAAAGVARAARVVIVCEDDRINGEVAAALVNEVRDRVSGVLECQIQVSNADLVDRLRRRGVERVEHDRVLLEFFCVHQVAARRLLVRHPPFLDPTHATGVLVVGDTLLAGSVIVQAARLWSVLPDRPRPLPMRVVAPAARVLIQRLRDRYPDIDQVCALAPCDADPVSGVTALAAAETIDFEQRVYVCLGDEAQGLAVASALVDTVVLATPVVVQAAHQRGLTELAVRFLDPGPGITAFGVTEVACDPDGLFGDMWHELARSIHETYRVHRATDPTWPASGPETTPWEELAEGYRAGNLDQARHIGSKLAAIGARPVPLLSPLEVAFRFTDEEVEQLAELEHERWNGERRAAGWTLGPKNNKRRTTPYLVPYRELSPDIQEYDRSAVRAIPSLLASVGYRIARTAPSPALPTAKHVADPG
ncbi:MAG: NAD-binding protein [Pseudonocardiaceae bacterium]